MSVSAYRASAFGLRCTGHLSPAASLQALRYVHSRNYATESALASKKKGAPSAKSTHRATAVSSAAPKRSSAKVADRATGHSTQTAAAAEVKTLPQKSEVAKPAPALSTEEQNLKELEALQYFSQVMRDADPYGQPVPQSLDVVLARPAGLSTIPKYGLKGWWTQAMSNVLNSCKSAMSILYLAGDNALPGIQLGNVPWYKGFGWIPKAFTSIKSTKETGWLAPLRREALQSYIDLNTAVAARDSKKAKTLSTAEFQSEILRRLKKQPAGLQFRWSLEREVSPVQVLSLRATQYYMAKEDPKFGNRFMVHALVKFDTEQSLEIYGPRGEPLHEVPEGAVKRPNGTMPAKPKRVTEYLVIEKRMWYDTPWLFREQRWDVSK